LKFKNDAVGGMHLSSQQLWGKKYDRIEITGEESYVILDGLWRMEHYAKDGNHFWEPSPDHRSQFLTGDAYAVRHFAESIINNIQPISNIRDGYEAMKLFKVLHKKAGEVVCLDEI
jgi:predicted dehydrogenase